MLVQLQGQVFREGREDEGDDFIRNLKEGIKQQYAGVLISQRALMS